MKLSTAFALLGAASTAFPGVSAHEMVSCVVFRPLCHSCCVRPLCHSLGWVVYAAHRGVAAADVHHPLYVIFAS